jgi:hypothetical protein
MLEECLEIKREICVAKDNREQWASYLSYNPDKAGEFNNHRKKQDQILPESKAVTAIHNLIIFLIQLDLKVERPRSRDAIYMWKRVERNLRG